MKALQFTRACAIALIDIEIGSEQQAPEQQATGGRDPAGQSIKFSEAKRHHQIALDTK
jgi:hypothetical protein